MAHGNLSDVAFLMVLAIVVQLCAFPDVLYQDVGPFKAQFSKRSADMDAVAKFCGSMLFMFGFTLSGVKWNPINGKMAGFGGFIASAYAAYSTFKADSDAFVPRLFYIYSAVLLFAALSIFAMPSNPLTPKSPKTKNNHGNFSDMVALPLIGVGVLCLAYPDHFFQEFGPVKAQFKASSADLIVMIKFAGCLILTIGLTLSGVKWNPINGKMAGFGGFTAAGYTVYSTFKADGDAFVPKVFYIYAALIFLGALHIFVFPSNEVPPKVEKKD